MGKKGERPSMLLLLHERARHKNLFMLCVHRYSSSVLINSLNCLCAQILCCYAGRHCCDLLLGGPCSITACFGVAEKMTLIVMCTLMRILGTHVSTVVSLCVTLQRWPPLTSICAHRNIPRQSEH